MKKSHSKRQDANRAIIARLSALVEKYPDWRFHQILDNANLTAATEDRFYEESVDTFKNMKSL